MGIRILVIEDEKEIADFIVRGLREEGFSIERAANGERNAQDPIRQCILDAYSRVEAAS